MPEQLYDTDLNDTAVADAWEPPPIESEDQFEEALREYASLEAEKTSGQCHALKVLVDRYQHQLKLLQDKIARKQQRLALTLEAYGRPLLEAKGRKTYEGAFATVRVTKKKYAHEFSDQKQFIDWAEHNARHLLTEEIKHIQKPDRSALDAYIRETAVIPDGVEVRDETGFTITPVKAG